MDNFFRNRIKFRIRPEEKTKDLVIVPYAEIKDIFKRQGFLFLSKQLQELLKKTVVKLDLPEHHLVDFPQGSVVLVKVDKDLSHRKGIILARKTFNFIKNSKRKSFSVFLSDIVSLFVSVDQEERLIEDLVKNFILADFDFGQYYKSKPKEGWNEIKEITIFVKRAKLTKIKQALSRGIVTGEEVNRARFLSNLPGGDLVPKDLVLVAREIARESDLKIKVLDKKALEKIKAGGILGVGRGSKEKPYLVILEYKRAKSKMPEIHFIGKGITFDTGGLHIKPGDSMNEMHMDMSGAASVLAATSLIAKLKLPVHLIALLPLAENMISGESYRPGDILKTLSGKTVEIGSPDAEGRVVLADAISYGKKFYHPDLIVELSTLTGAAMVALGNKAAGLFCSEERLEPILRQIGERSGDYVWPLPLWEEYTEDIKAPFADIWNIGKSRYGGASHGAVFLWEFAKPTPFVHLDIAPRMTATGQDHLKEGSLGFGVSYLKEVAIANREIEKEIRKNLK
jgi:leucyl aminopeptidase